MTARRRENRPTRRPTAGLPADGLTFIEEAEANPGDAQELAAARFALSVEQGLGEAFALAGMDRTTLARGLGVSPSAVSQVLDSDGNLRIATIGRYARALGYQASLRLDPVAADCPPLDLPAPANVGAMRGSATLTVLTLESGRAWTAETEGVETTIGQMIFRTVCTPLHAENDPFPTGAATDVLLDEVSS